jgi:hypothetical protein
LSYYDEIQMKTEVFDADEWDVAGVTNSPTLPP